MKTRTVAVKPMVPWYNEEIRLAKKERRKAERKWRRTKTPTDFNLFKTLKNRVTYIMNKARCSFLSDFVEKNSDDQGKLFRAIKTLLVEKDVLFFLAMIRQCSSMILVTFLCKKFPASALNWASKLLLPQLIMILSHLVTYHFLMFLSFYQKMTFEIL